MRDDHVERNMILNENDSRTMSSLRFTVNKKRHKRFTSSKLYVSKCLHRKCAIDIYGGRDALV